MGYDAGSSKANRPTEPSASSLASGEQTVYIDWGPALPDSYGRPRILALVRDPRAFFACWEGGDRIRARDLTGGGVQEHAVGTLGSWYFEGTPEHEYVVDLLSAGRPVASSAIIRLPRLDPAVDVDPGWMPTPGQEELLRALLGAPEAGVDIDGAGASKSWRRRIAGKPVSRPSRTS